MPVFQKEVQLNAVNRGFHLISDIVESIIRESNVSHGICHVFIKHTSASLTINENADPTVREDFESYFNNAVRENEPYFLHTYEGADDMPAHIKASLLGNSIQVPITNGKLNFHFFLKRL